MTILRVWVVALLALAAGPMTAGGGWPPVAPSPQNAPAFKAESDLVVLHVMVRDRSGSYVPGLSAEAFRVTEENEPQTIRFFASEDAPVTVGLVLDSSGSMRGARDRVIAASAAFVRTSNPQDEIFAFVFNDDVQPVLPAAMPFTSDAAILQSALAGAFAPRGRTALHDAVLRGLEHAANGNRDRRALVILSDGGDNISRATFDEVLRQAQRSNVVLYLVALADPLEHDANPKHLERLAETTGGEAFAPDAAAKIDGVFQQIARDLRHGYTIGYSPAEAPQHAGFRRVHVTVQPPDGRRLVVRTRTGYFAGPAVPAGNASR